MRNFSQVMVWTVFSLNHMAISGPAMNTNSENNLEGNSKSLEIQPSRKVSTEGGDLKNMFSTSIYLDPSASYPNFKRQKLNDRDEGILRHNQQEVHQPWELYSLDRYPLEPSKRLRDGTMMDGAYLSLGPPIDLGSSSRTTENLEGSSRGAPRMERKIPTGHEDSHLSSSERSIYNHQDTALSLVSSHSGIDQTERDQSRSVVHKMNEVSTPYTSQVAHTPDSFKNIDLQRAFDNLYGSLDEQGIKTIKQAFVPSAAGIDIRNFRLHTPIKMISAAAIHYTQDLIKTLTIKYPTQAEVYIYPSWKLGKSMWTFERLLPFVYFVVSFNPSRKVWSDIKRLTAYCLRLYHQQSIDTNSILNEEKHARFLLWHTEVMYHSARSEPMIKESNAQIKNTKLSTLARMFLLMNDDYAFKRFFNSNIAPMLERHIAGTFENDYKLGYPVPHHDQEIDIDSSTLGDWMKKSDQIRSLGKDVDWPEVPVLTWAQSEPVLLMNGNLYHDSTLKKHQELHHFMNYWKRDLKDVVLQIRISQPTNLALPGLSLVKICKGIHEFVKGNFENNEKETDLGGRTKPIEYQVTLFSRFLHQDLNDDYFKRFWKYFELL